MKTSDPDPLVGRIIARKIELLQVLGSGGMGKVYRAHHLALDKVVAVKLLHPGDVTSRSALARFRAEARAASRLDHPNSLQVLDFGVDGDDRVPYIAMEFVEGTTLQVVLAREGRLTPQRSGWISGQVLSALAAAHDHGIVHRDVKPGNIMLSTRRGDQGPIEDFVKVCDFGLAKILDASSHSPEGGPITQRGAVIGTPAYMSPEQAKGEPVDHRTDLYSVAVILYRCLAGRKPFTAESPWAVSLKHISDDPPNLLERVPDLDPRLAAFVHAGLAKRPEDRFQSARDMKNELAEIIGLESITAYYALSGDAGLTPPTLDDATVHESPARGRTATRLQRPPPASEQTPPDPTPSVAGFSSPPRAWLLAAAGLVITGAAVGLAWRSRAPEPPAPKPPVAASEPRPRIAPPPAEVRLSVVGTPAGTRVSGPGGPLGEAPGAIVVPRSHEPLTLTFTADGFEPLVREVVPDGDGTVRVDLEPMQKRNRRPRPRPRRAKPIRDRHALENPFD